MAMTMHSTPRAASLSTKYNFPLLQTKQRNVIPTVCIHTWGPEEPKVITAWTASGRDYFNLLRAAAQ